MKTFEAKTLEDAKRVACEELGITSEELKYNIIDEVPVIMISSEQNPEVVRSCYELGVTDFINRPFDFEVVKKRVSNTILLYAKQRKLSEIIADQIRDSERTQNLMVSILSHIVEFRNGESGLHVLHISKISSMRAL